MTKGWPSTDAIAPANDRLSEVRKVFYFPHNQEDLVGTNGLETMRELFFDSRVVVVLYCEPWGKNAMDWN